MISSIICAGNLHGGVVSAEIIHYRAGVVVLVFILFEVVLKCVFFDNYMHCEWEGQNIARMNPVPKTPVGLP